MTARVSNKGVATRVPSCNVVQNLGQGVVRIFERQQAKELWFQQLQLNARQT
jgi:hypothetical protein